METSPELPTQIGKPAPIKEGPFGKLLTAFFIAAFIGLCAGVLTADAYSFLSIFIGFLFFIVMFMVLSFIFLRH